MRFLSNVKYIVLCLLLFLMAISYHPYFFGDINAEVDVGNRVLSLPIYVVFGILVLLSLFTIRRINTKLFRVSIISLLIILVVAELLFAFIDNSTMISDVRAWIMVIGSIVIGKSMEISKRQLVILISIYGLTALFSGIMQVYQNIGGFIIVDQYLANSKNSLGAIIATVVISFIYLALYSKKTWRIFYYVLAVLGVAIVLTIRARASFLALSLVAVIVFMKPTRSKGIGWTMAVISIFILALILLPDGISNYVIDSITAGRERSDISSGRMEVYQGALAILKNNPFFGNTFGQQQIGWVHNYLLLKLSNFGLIFAWPLLAYYFYLLLYCIKNMWNKTHLSKGFFIFSHGFALLLVLFVISMLEPTFPFAPGTAVAFNFIMLGLADSVLTSSKSKIVY